MKFILFSLLLVFSSFISWSPYEVAVDKREKSLNVSKKYPKVRLISFCCRGEDFYIQELYDNYYSSRKDDLGLSKNKNLRHISLWYTNIEKFLTKSYLPQLESFAVYSIEDRFDNEAISVFSIMPNLKNLVLHVSNINTVRLEKVVQYCPYLESLELYLSYYHDYIPEESLAIIANFPNLKKLRLAVSPEVNDAEAMQQTLSELLPQVNVSVTKVIYNYD